MPGARVCAAGRAGGVPHPASAAGGPALAAWWMSAGAEGGLNRRAGSLFYLCDLVAFAAGEQTKVIEEKTYSIEEQTKVIEEKTYSIEEQTKVIEEKTYSIEEQTKVIEEKTHSTEEQTKVTG
ncbi:MAG: hypothetical protein Q9O74_07335 [Planctomycetota bacterium]|nr:hypothetical protein [Planctomycetota bacterium]